MEYKMVQDQDEEDALCSLVTPQLMNMKDVSEALTVAFDKMASVECDNALHGPVEVFNSYSMLSLAMYGPCIRNPDNLSCMADIVWQL